MLDLSLREVSSILGVLTFAGLLWRTIGFLPWTSWLERCLAVLLLSTVIIGAVGTYNLDTRGAPASGVIHLILIHRVLCLVLVAFWPRLMGRRRKKP